MKNYSYATSIGGKERSRPSTMKGKIEKNREVVFNA